MYDRVQSFSTLMLGRPDGGIYVDTAAVFNFQFFCSLFMFGLVATWFVWPRLTRMGRIEALTPLFVYSAFRYLGTFFLVTQMTAGLPREWAGPAAYLDILSA